MIIIVWIFVICVIVHSLSESRSKKPTLTLHVGKYHTTRFKNSKPEMGVKGDDLVLDCGCICKYTITKTDNHHLTSEHTSTIRCLDCQKKEDDFEKNRKELFGE